MNSITKITRTVAEKQIGVSLNMVVEGEVVHLSVLVDSEECELNARFTKSDSQYGQAFGVYVTSADAKPPSAIIEDKGASAYIEFDSVFVSVRMAESGVIVDIYDLDEDNESVLNSCYAEYKDLVNKTAQCA